MGAEVLFLGIALPVALALLLPRSNWRRLLLVGTIFVFWPEISLVETRFLPLDDRFSGALSGSGGSWF